MTHALCCIFCCIFCIFGFFLAEILAFHALKRKVPNGVFGGGEKNWTILNGPFLSRTPFFPCKLRFFLHFLHLHFRSFRFAIFAPAPWLGSVTMEWWWRERALLGSLPTKKRSDSILDPSFIVFCVSVCVAFKRQTKTIASQNNFFSRTNLCPLAAFTAFFGTLPKGNKKGTGRGIFFCQLQFISSRDIFPSEFQLLWRHIVVVGSFKQKKKMENPFGWCNTAVSAALPFLELGLSKFDLNPEDFNLVRKSSSSVRFISFLAERFEPVGGVRPFSRSFLGSRASGEGG